MLCYDSKYKETNNYFKIRHEFYRRIFIFIKKRKEKIRNLENRLLLLMQIVFCQESADTILYKLLVKFHN